MSKHKAGQKCGVERPDVGDIVEILAVDWVVQVDEVERDHEWEVMRGWVYGEVIHVGKKSVTVAPQTFSHGTVRFAVTVPWATVLRVRILGKAVRP